jgi:hypothetical protein
MAGRAVPRDVAGPGTRIGDRVRAATVARSRRVALFEERRRMDHAAQSADRVDVPALIGAFLRQARGPAFGRLRDAVLGSPDYRFGDDALRRLEPLARTAAPEVFLSRLPECMPGFLLTARLHLLAARCADRVGDALRARFERHFARCCLEGLLHAGTGAAETPYPVTHLEDAHDLLDHLGVQASSWQRLPGGAGVVDRARLEDGRELHFDVSGAASTPFAAAVF